jgi:Flp pilus assembly protein TadG
LQAGFGILLAMQKNRKSPASWSRFKTDATGTSAVEFAMLAPLFIVLLLGIVAYGIYFGASHSVQQIAADAARTAIAGLNQTERQTLVSDFIAHDVAGYPFVDPNKLTVNAQDSVADGSQFVVSVSYDARNLPIWNLFPKLPLPGTTIQRQSTIRVGGI